MTRHSRSSSGKPTRNKDSSAIKEKDGNHEITKTLIGAIGAIIVALIAYFGSIKPTMLQIEATQTAEAKVATIAATTPIFTEQITETPSPIPTATYTDIVKPTETPLPPSSITPTEIKNIRYEYIVEKGDTLGSISKKFLITDFYGSAIGRANCNMSPTTGDILIIRYYYVQLGDTIDLISERYGGSPNFLRSINNLSSEVIFPPAGQIFILPGKCSRP